MQRKPIHTTKHSITFTGNAKTIRARLKVLMCIYGPEAKVTKVIEHLEYVKPLYNSFTNVYGDNNPWKFILEHECKCGCENFTL